MIGNALLAGILGAHERVGAKAEACGIDADLERPDAGYILVNGEYVGYRRVGDRLHEVRERDLCASRAAIGMVFQRFNLFQNMTVLDNVTLAPRLARRTAAAEAERKALALLERVGLAGKKDRYPHRLSGGEQQRVAIARAIAKQPDILLCDEPTGALDSQTGVLVLEAVERIHRELGTTTALITHNAVIADMADRVLVLGDGRIQQERRNPRRRPARELAW